MTPRRQRLRRGLIYVAALLFPVVFMYFSPVQPIMAALEGAVAGSLVVFGLQFLSGLVLGRAFCGWACPGAGLQEAAGLANEKPAKGGRADWIKYVIWVPWLAGVIVAFIAAGGPKSVEFFYQTTHGVSLASLQAYVPYLIVLALIVGLALTAGRRGFCHYACWMAPFLVLGTKLQQALRLPALHLRATPERCIACGRCQKRCAMSLPVTGLVKAGRMTHSECILCGACVDACPRRAIRYAFGRTKERDGTGLARPSVSLASPD